MARTEMQRQAALRAKAFGDTRVTADRRRVVITAKGLVKAARKARKVHKRATRAVKPFKWHV